MLLSRNGLRVLLLDKAHFPSDTVSTHYLHQSGVARLRDWGLLDRIVASGCPPMTEIAWDIEGITFAGHPPSPDGAPHAFGPRRTVLDAILVEAAIEAGAEFRDGFTVKELLWDDERVVGVRGRSHGGATVDERAKVVIGADGLRSTVAAAVDAEIYEEAAARTSTYYSYWSIQLDHLEFHERPGIGAAAFPTNDGLSMVSVAWSTRAYPSGVPGNLEDAFKEGLGAFPSLHERVSAAERAARFAGMAHIPNHFRRSAGPGWALVGDAGYHKDPAAAEGITDAYRAATLLVEELLRWAAGAVGPDEALATYARRRDEAAMPWFRWAVRAATFDPLPPPLRQLLEAVAANQQLADLFCGLNAETVDPRLLFPPGMLDA